MRNNNLTTGAHNNNKQKKEANKVVDVEKSMETFKKVIAGARDIRKTAAKAFSSSVKAQGGNQPAASSSGTKTQGDGQLTVSSPSVKAQGDGQLTASSPSVKTQGIDQLTASSSNAKMQRVDQAKIEEGVRLILEGIGEDVHREGLLKTPYRVAKMYEEIFSGMHEDPAELFQVTFDEGHDEIVIVRDIPFYSICEHHLVPFFGHAHVAYLPRDDGRVCGISKLARLVDVYAKRPQIQERLTNQIANTLQEQMKPRGVMVIMEAEHLCMSMRGVKKPGCKTTTSALRGIFRQNHSTRSEALSLISRGK